MSFPYKFLKILFNLIGGGGDGRLRPQHHQAVKCPRCGSLNTKFCYYNNYNLSQPRHFCKSCRRYWTKGGILRNIPVGGGCRKAKRTKNKASLETTASAMPHPEQQQRKTNSHSSSDSSSLTATNSNATLSNNNNNSYPGGGGTAEAVTSHANLINNISEAGPDLKFYGNANNLGLEAEPGSGSGSDQCGIFSEVGSFASLITPSNNETLSFGFNHKVLNGEGQQQRCMGMGGSEEEITGGLLELSNMHSSSDNGFGASDWQVGNGDQGLFDLPNHVDNKTYWTQTQWTHQDHPTLYLP